MSFKLEVVSGLLVPDLLLEYTHEIREACEKQGVELMLLTTPTTPPDRMREIAKYSQGFVYLVSLTGVTGTRTSINDRVPGLIQTLHDVSDKPVRQVSLFLLKDLDRGWIWCIDPRTSETATGVGGRWCNYWILFG